MIESLRVLVGPAKLFQQSEHHRAGHSERELLFLSPEHQVGHAIFELGEKEGVSGTILDFQHLVYVARLVHQFSLPCWVRLLSEGQVG